jgi:glutamyl-tRNA synthetase
MAPVYRHIPLAADAEGKRLSKRDGSQSLRQLKEKGLSPEEIWSLIKSLPDVSP